MLMESLRTRMARPAVSSREARPQRSRATINSQPGDSRGERAAALDLLPALRGSRFLLLAVKDRDGRYLETNAAYAGALGLSPEAIRGRLDRDLLAPDIAGEMAQRERLALRGVTLKPELEWFGGETPAYLVERLPILDDRGQVLAICVIAMEPPAVRSAEIVTVPAVASVEPELAPEPAVPAEVPWLSFGAAALQLEWDAVLYRSLLSGFCDRHEGLGVRLAERIADGSDGELARELERLSNSARNLGACPLAELAGELVRVLERDGEVAFAGSLARFTRALDATILVMEQRIGSICEPLEWPSPIEEEPTSPGWAVAARPAA